jgi:2-polyprenyl-3-methyl-5-hydroxy-6-metoxy-1,4-benzoquinol methylase
MPSKSPRDLAPPTCLCGWNRFNKVFTYDAPPPGETRFSFSFGETYYREVLECEVCHHFISRHHLSLEEIYQNEYVGSTYGNAAEIHTAFQRIMALPPDRSDNVGRVKRVVDFAAAYLTEPLLERRPPTVLDVGCGLGVFLARMKEAGWQGTGLDVDPRLIEHARESVGVAAVRGDFTATEGLGQFDVVTFNKVLEHVTDPVPMLARSAANLRQHGFIYVEVPDGEAAVAAGPDREEFFIEHHHIFSMASLALLASRAGFLVRQMERLQEPSTKYTLRAFLVRF